MIKILFICHGNICRSPMAQFVLEDMVEKAGMRDQFMIDSCATSREEIGNGVHYGTKDKLRKEGVRMHDHRARQLTKKDYEEYDYLIGMEETNIRNMKYLLGGDNPRDSVDLWYTGNFDITYTDIVEGCEAFLKTLKK